MGRILKIPVPDRAQQDPALSGHESAEEGRAVQLKSELAALPYAQQVQLLRPPIPLQLQRKPAEPTTPPTVEAEQDAEKLAVKGDLKPQIQAMVDSRNRELSRQRPRIPSGWATAQPGRQNQASQPSAASTAVQQLADQDTESAGDEKLQKPPTNRRTTRHL
ncbi:MAG: hypothetical protein JW797_19240 [Bradymonadales bacterium]|nr:hypothetical protein [Bradymonadales bacterium]